MSEYTAQALLAEASLKLDLLEDGLGVAFIEGEDDRRCLADRHIPLDQLVVTGGKEPLLGAYALITDEDQRRFVFLCDCDYDVPAGALQPTSNLIVTRNASLETDLIQIGLLQQVVQELVPRAKWRGSAMETAGWLTSSAVALAGGLGSIRLVARARGIPIQFANLSKNLRRYRGETGADIQKMLVVIRGDPDQPPIDQMFDEEVEGQTPELRHCDGHDLIEAVRVIFRDDLRLGKQELDAVDRILRTALTPAAFERLEFAQRLRRWEAATGQTIVGAQ